MTRRAPIVVLLALLSACSITQQVKPVTSIAGKEICVIDNPAVRAGFADAYRRSLASKGLTVKWLPAGSNVDACPMTSTYTATWRWDLALYLAYAQIQVYGNGKPIGEAKYDSMAGSGNLNKFIDAEKKVDELVTLLFASKTP